MKRMFSAMDILHFTEAMLRSQKQRVKEVVNKFSRESKKDGVESIYSFGSDYVPQVVIAISLKRAKPSLIGDTKREAGSHKVEEIRSKQA